MFRTYNEHHVLFNDIVVANLVGGEGEESAVADFAAELLRVMHHGL
jgi:hypothetical protein